MGVMDSLTKGFQSVHRHWWVLLIPVLLDAFLWIGPQASIETLAQEAFRNLEADIGALPSPPDETVSVTEMFEQVLAELVPRYNGFSALRVGILGVPSLLMWGGALLGSPSSYEVLWVTLLKFSPLTASEVVTVISVMLPARRLPGSAPVSNALLVVSIVTKLLVSKSYLYVLLELKYGK